MKKKVLILIENKYSEYLFSFMKIFKKEYYKKFKLLRKNYKEYESYHLLMKNKIKDLENDY